MRVRDERGSVVAEFAVALPAVLLVLAVLLAGVQIAALQLRVHDAAADAARGWARGDATGTVVSRVHRQVPGAVVSRSARGDLVCATVGARPVGPAARLGVRVGASSCALAGGR